ncbi:MAG TPA: ATP-binding cassette domain-containing protein [Blastococcus sp.]|jgi:ABC-2 type transport system ATP-binding protein|nr:ATP-binding cassette domain-containing protein [Blastococcus sp.]
MTRSASDVVIRTEGLGKRFGHAVALTGLDLSVGAGEVFGYLGPNGAGKTTTLRLLMGMLRPSTGRAEVLGRDAWRDAVAVHRAVGYLPGEPVFYPKLTGRQHIEYFGALRHDDDDRWAVALADRLDLDLDRPAHALSKGNRQKLAVVLALMSRPPVLILDEPTSGLDPIVQQEFQALMREHNGDGGSVLLSSHVLGEVERVADRIGVLRAGRLVAVERIDQLRAKSLHHVSARFGEDVSPAEFSGIPGVRDLVVDGRSLTCSAPQTALDALLRRITRHPVVDLGCAEAELEETFLTYYGSTPNGPVEVPAPVGVRDVA